MIKVCITLFSIFYMKSLFAIVNGCYKVDVSITQKVEKAGFHRDIRWIIEVKSPTNDEWIQSKCKLALQLNIPSDMYVNPDEIADLMREREISAYINSSVDVETMAHQSQQHTTYIFLPNQNIEKILVKLPVHLRYQLARVGGGYVDVQLNMPSFLIHCPEKSICGNYVKLRGPCDSRGRKICLWKNVTYEALSDVSELLVPVGNIDDYPLVCMITLLLGCAGCIYILSIITTQP